MKFVPSIKLRGALPTVRYLSVGILLPVLAAALLGALNTRAVAGIYAAIVNCSNTTACQGGTNAGTGAGVQGKSASGNGVAGISTGASSTKAGVSGSTASGSILSEGVLGTSTGFGAGVVGTTTGSSGCDGVMGVSTTGSGVSGWSDSSYGMFASSDTGVALAAISDTGGPGVYTTVTRTNTGVYSVSQQGMGLEVASGGGPAIYAEGDGQGPAVVINAPVYGNALQVTSSGGGPVAASVYNSNGDGAEVNGSYIGVIARAPAGVGTFPLVVTDQSSNDLFFVNGNGDVYYHGTLNTFAATNNGGMATAYGSKSASPTVEDTGTAQLSNGTANVRLDPAFARTIDSRKPYQVLLTPDADTRGLYVSIKSPDGFAVREVQGGRGTFGFDYHIYGTAVGHAYERMSLVGRSRGTMPKAMMAHRYIVKHTHPVVRRPKRVR